MDKNFINNNYFNRNKNPLNENTNDIQNEYNFNDNSLRTSPNINNCENISNNRHYNSYLSQNIIYKKPLKKIMKKDNSFNIINNNTNNSSINNKNFVNYQENKIKHKSICQISKRNTKLNNQLYKSNIVDFSIINNSSDNFQKMKINNEFKPINNNSFTLNKRTTNKSCEIKLHKMKKKKKKNKDNLIKNSENYYYKKNNLKERKIIITPQNSKKNYNNINKYSNKKNESESESSKNIITSKYRNKSEDKNIKTIFKKKKGTNENKKSKIGYIKNKKINKSFDCTTIKNKKVNLDKKTNNIKTQNHNQVFFNPSKKISYEEYLRNQNNYKLAELKKMRQKLIKDIYDKK